MGERLYTAYPAVYDAIQAEWDYDRDVRVLERGFAAADRPIDRILEVGVGTGEHTRRLERAGYELLGIDKHRGMLTEAQSKTEAALWQAALPALATDTTVDAVVALRGVINHLDPAELHPALSAMHDCLRPGGVCLFDNARLPPDGNELALDVVPTARGDAARFAQHVATGDGTLDWRSVVFLPDGSFFVNRRSMTPFTDEAVVDALGQVGFAVDSVGELELDGNRTVFAAERPP